MKINWKVRIANKQFWLSAIPAVLLVIQVVGAVFGYTLDFGDLGNKFISCSKCRICITCYFGSCC